MVDDYYELKLYSAELRHFCLHFDIGAQRINGAHLADRFVWLPWSRLVGNKRSSTLNRSLHSRTPPPAR